MNNRLLITLILFSAICHAQSFKGSFDLKISQESNDGNQHIETISYYFGEEKTATIIHARGNQPSLRLIFNPADSTITGTYEMNDKKGGYILPMNNKYWPTMKYALGEKDTLNNSERNFTSNKKEIETYNTTAISCSNDKIDATFWIAEEIELSLTQVMAYQFVGSGEEGDDLEMLANCGIKSLALYTSLFDKKRNSTIILQIENLSTKVDITVFNTSGYNLSDMRKEK
ncbi:hypothetical protein K8089_08300 [Aequorivita sp. F47161]|uniref:DUF4412 domain-containing protein n=1 Tax=Aequorivita vitellina TaxID=2874475 RepID=A0A9X1QXQ6_9FLAO|nr:hypothetical protein [Aequorivita vitellina]MCG2419023.1 hypothetical protein [Aequorivita vitellina]